MSLQQGVDGIRGPSPAKVLKGGKAASSFAIMALIPYLYFPLFPWGSNSGSLLGFVLQLLIVKFSDRCAAYNSFCPQKSPAAHVHTLYLH